MELSTGTVLTLSQRTLVCKLGIYSSEQEVGRAGDPGDVEWNVNIAKSPL